MAPHPRGASPSRGGASRGGHSRESSGSGMGRGMGMRRGRGGLGGARGGSMRRGGASRLTSTGPRLPAALSTELGEEEGGAQKRTPRVASRAQLRRREKEDKKRRIREYHRRNKVKLEVPVRGGVRSDADGGGARAAIRPRAAPDATGTDGRHSVPVEEKRMAVRPQSQSQSQGALGGLAGKKSKFMDLLRDSNLIPLDDAARERRAADATQDDAEIRRLEKMLGLKGERAQKKKKLPGSFGEEGLDYLLNFEEGDEEGGASGRAGGDGDGDGNGENGDGMDDEDDGMDDEDDGMMVNDDDDDMMEDGDGMVDSDDDGMMDDDDGDDMMEDDDGVEGDTTDDSDVGEMDVDRSGESAESAESDGGTALVVATATARQSSGPKSASSSTGPSAARTAIPKTAHPAAVDAADAADAVDSKGVSGGRYVPPSKRGAATADEAALRAVKGLLNRISAANIERVCGDLQAAYGTHGRARTNDAVARVLLESVADENGMLRRLVAVAAAVVACLHASMGVEIGAFLLQAIARKFTEMYDAGDRSCVNLAVLIAHLLPLGTIHASLVSDYVRLFMRRFTEDDIELINAMLQTAGHAMRADDPAVLRDTIVAIQERAAEAARARSGEAQPPRVRFMLDMIYEIKNNRRSARGTGTQADEVDVLARTVKAVAKKSGSVGDIRMRVSLEDLTAAGTQGQWWLVGAAWAGKSVAAQENDAVSREAGGPPLDKGDQAARLAVLARKYHMNTDVRRAIFNVLMTSDDYADAFERIVRMRLRDAQEREVMRVALECSLHERAFNPFYVHLAAKLCQHSHNHKITFQYALWDRIKTIADASVRHIARLAEFTAHLVRSFSVSLSVLKVINFADLEPKTLVFLRLLFVAVLADGTEDAVRGAFKRIAAVSDLEALREGIVLFLHHYVRGGDTLGRDKTVVKSRMKVAEEALRDTGVFSL